MPLCIVWSWSCLHTCSGRRFQEDTIQVGHSSIAVLAGARSGQRRLSSAGRCLLQLGVGLGVAQAAKVHTQRLGEGSEGPGDPQGWDGPTWDQTEDHSCNDAFMYGSDTGALYIVYSQDFSLLTQNMIEYYNKYNYNNMHFFSFCSVSVKTCTNCSSIFIFFNNWTYLFIVI